MTTAKIALIASGGANFYSIEMALQRLNVAYQLTNDAKVILAADAAILPGVGSAKYAMAQLAQHGLIDVLQNYRKPLLGICLGMQLLYEASAEGDVPCLGILPGKIQRFSSSLPVPHMGWNNLLLERPSSLLTGLDLNQEVYFVHSYYAPVNQVTVASCDYTLKFAAVVEQHNFCAMQFHPEKSGAMGESLLANFVNRVAE